MSEVSEVSAARADWRGKSRLVEQKHIFVKKQIFVEEAEGVEEAK